MLRKVFLVFDNVGSEKNMKDLQVHAFKNAQNGSKAIVTTQRRQVLLENYCDGIFDVDFLNEEQASELFSFYAFHGVDDEERMQLGDQAKAIIKACGGLPLSLEVIGQFLRKYNSFEIEERMPIWEEALKRLQEAMPFEGCDDEELWATLKISYDDLAKGEQNMFLDFACIICETWSIDYKFRVRKDWLARIWNSPISVQNLINMSLIKWNDDKQSLVIHESLRDMGRGIVKKALVDGNMSRIWRKDDGLKFTLQNKNLQIVEGLVLGGVRESEFAQQLDSANRRIDMGGKSYFEKLRLLDLRESDLKVVEYYVQSHLDELTWLCLDWTDITISSIKALGSFTKLRILEMTSCIELEQLPTSINNLSLLTELHLHSCKNLKTLPETIGNLKNLQILMLRQCRSLERLPTSIGGLKSLKSLDCGFCISLTEVPAKVGQLLKLEYLSFGYCPKLKTLCNFETKMDRLRELNLINCRSLETIKWLGNLHRLQTLRISGNLWIDNLPDQLGQLSELHELDLRGCDRLDKGILETIQKGQLCTNHLVILGLPIFPEIGLPPSTHLKTLRLLTHGNQMEKLSESLGNLSHLEYLNINDFAYKLKVLPDALCKLEMLTKLEMENLHLLEELPVNIGHLSSLQCLIIFNCTKLVELPLSMGNLSQLQRLELQHCKSLEHLPETLKRLTRLSYLGILNCIKLQCWESDQSSILQMLKFIGCKIQRFYDSETNRSFLQLIDVEADKDVIAQFIEEVQSQLSSNGLTKNQ